MAALLAPGSLHRLKHQIGDDGTLVLPGERGIELAFASRVSIANWNEGTHTASRGTFPVTVGFSLDIMIPGGLVISRAQNIQKNTLRQARGEYSSISRTREGAGC
jgi:hypothetical protein